MEYTGASMGDCGSELPPPGPDFTGRRESAHYNARFVGYPIYHTGLRITLSPFQGQPEELQLTAGLERAWRQRLWIPTLGLTDVVGEGPLRLLLEAEFAWYTTSLTRTTDDYVNGSLISSTATEEPQERNVVRLSVGVLIRH